MGLRPFAKSEQVNHAESRVELIPARAGRRSVPGARSVSAKPKSRPASALDFAGGEDEKMGKIVEEVDRFFKSVHADIEDWKFSMEEYGDGTRIFVRFQIHINKGNAPAGAKGPSPMALAPERRDAPSSATPVAGKRSEPEGRTVAEAVREPGGTGLATRAELDLASFVEVWRSRKDTSKGAEFHKEGAPFLDSEPEPKSRDRAADKPSADTAGKRAGASPRAPDAGVR
jgi:hypothetical protein